ncbi:MAG: hypothetical protein Q7T18_09920 [Sedimentisphaerales bacterium]|nr:hypothetical protein [Sedimentisphaerales bacterium]
MRRKYPWIVGVVREGKIANPKALKNDLSKSEQGFTVAVIVEPK